VKVFA
jgi:hypothetical protein